MPDKHGDIKDKNINFNNFIELYKIVVDTRKFEIENFWKRALFFWGALAIILVGYFKIPVDYNEYSIFISFLALIYNIIFSLGIRGSKFWQENWEFKAKEFQDEFVKESKLEKNRSYYDIFGKLTLATIIENRNKTTRLLRSYRFSVSKLTLLLSDITALFITTLFVKDIIILIQNTDFDICNSSQAPNYVAIIFPVLFILTALYFYKFLKYEMLRNEEDENKLE